MLRAWMRGLFASICGCAERGGDAQACAIKDLQNCTKPPIRWPSDITCECQCHNGTEG